LSSEPHIKAIFNCLKHRKQKCPVISASPVTFAAFIYYLSSSIFSLVPKGMLKDLFLKSESHNVYNIAINYKPQDILDIVDLIA